MLATREGEVLEDTEVFEDDDVKDATDIEEELGVDSELLARPPKIWISKTASMEHDLD